MHLEPGLTTKDPPPACLDATNLLPQQPVQSKATPVPISSTPLQPLLPACFSPSSQASPNAIVAQKAQTRRSQTQHCSTDQNFCHAEDKQRSAGRAF